MWAGLIGSLPWPDDLRELAGAARGGLTRYGRSVSVESQQLIVIRGNSGSGKTTLARDLQLAMGRGTANVGQDHLRRAVLREHDLPGADNIGLIAQTARHCLAIGYHVIVEGILYSKHYRSMLCELVDGHAGPSHVFYLDVSLEETLRRHAGRPLAAEVGPELLREWYRTRDVLGVPAEVVLDANLTPQQTLAVMRKHIGSVTPSRAHTAAHDRAWTTDARCSTRPHFDVSRDQESTDQHRSHPERDNGE